MNGNAFRELEEWHRNVDDLFSRFMARTPFADTAYAGKGRPSMETLTKNGDLVVRLDLPRVERHWNRGTTFVIFEPQQTTTEALIKLPQTDQTDALLRNSGLDFSYDRLRGRYRLRLGKDDIERSSNLLTVLMKKAQRAEAE
jgi:hypothetical protein